MELKHKPLIIRGEQYGDIAYYDDVEPELIAHNKQQCVIPAKFFYEKRLQFFVRNRFEPGENKHFPDGGFEVYGPDGGVYNYNLDEIILHPVVIKHTKTIRKMDEGTQLSDEIKAERALKYKNKDEKTLRSGGRKGRPKLSDEERELRESKKKISSGCGKGRPKLLNPKPVKVATGGKRGRPAMDPELKAIKLALAAEKALLPKRKRGRTKKLSK